MRKATLINLVLLYITLFSLLQSCVDDEAEFLARQNFTPDQSFAESFDTAEAAYSRGWRYLNKSVDIGPNNWQNPPTPPFGPYFSTSTNNGYLWADYNSTSSAAGIISNWAVSPVLIMKNGDTIVFYTRAQLYFFNGDSTDFTNRLQVRLNKKNDGLNVGDGADAGDFDITLLDINPFYKDFSYNAFIGGDPDVRSAYPHRWTRFEVLISGLDKPATGRFALRYFVEGAGNNGRATAIGIDQLFYTSAK